MTVQGHVVEAMTEVAGDMSHEQLQAAGYSADDLIESCLINQQPCDMQKDFTRMIDPDYGFCYTFNGGEKSRQSTSRIGHPYGLIMVVISKSDEYLFTTLASGIKIVVHSQRQDAFPNNNGLFLAVGTDSFVSIDYTSSKKLGPPYGECESGENRTDMVYSHRYSLEACYRSCFQHQVVAKCQCTDPRFPKPPVPEGGIQYLTCKTSHPNSTSGNCLQRFVEENGDYHMIAGCHCPHPCEEESYDATVSKSRWPQGQRYYGPSCTASVMAEHPSCSKYYSDNALRIEVFYHTLDYQVISEKPLMQPIDVFREIAGLYLFYLGASMVSLGEVFLLILQYVAHKFHHVIPDVPAGNRRNSRRVRRRPIYYDFDHRHT